MKQTILKLSFLHALLTVAYVVLVGLFLTGAENFFGSKEETVLIPIAMLTLFIFSAAITGSLVLGRPLLWYLDNKKKEAVSLFSHILGWLFLFVVIAFLLLATL